MSVLDDLIKKASESREQSAAQANPFLNGYKANEQKVWSDRHGNVNITDLGTGVTRRHYDSGTLEDVFGLRSVNPNKASPTKDSYLQDTAQALADHLHAQRASYKSALGSAVRGIAGLVHGDNNYQPEVGSWLWRMQEGYEAEKGVSAKLGEDSKYGKGWLHGLAMDLTGGAVDLAGDRVLDLILPGAGLYAMDIRNFGDSAGQSQVQGKSISTQMLNGAIHAAIGHFAEKAGTTVGRGKGTAAWGERLSSAIEGRLEQKGASKLVQKLIMGFGEEAAEEMLEDVLNPAVSKFVAGIDKGDYDAEEFPSLAEIAYDGLVGGLLGLMGGATEGIAATRAAKSGAAEVDVPVRKNGESNTSFASRVKDYIKTKANEHVDTALERAAEAKHNSEAASSPTSQTLAEAQQQSAPAEIASEAATSVKPEAVELNTELQAEQPKQKRKRKTAQDLAWETFYGDETRAREARDAEGIGVDASDFADEDSVSEPQAERVEAPTPAAELTEAEIKQLDAMSQDQLDALYAKWKGKADQARRGGGDKSAEYSEARLGALEQYLNDRWNNEHPSLTPEDVKKMSDVELEEALDKARAETDMISERVLEAEMDERANLEEHFHGSTAYQEILEERRTEERAARAAEKAKPKAGAELLAEQAVQKAEKTSVPSASAELTEAEIKKLDAMSWEQRNNLHAQWQEKVDNAQRGRGNRSAEYAEARLQALEQYLNDKWFEEHPPISPDEAKKMSDVDLEEAREKAIKEKDSASLKVIDDEMDERANLEEHFHGGTAYQEILEERRAEERAERAGEKAKNEEEALPPGMTPEKVANSKMTDAEREAYVIKELTWLTKSYKEYSGYIPQTYVKDVVWEAFGFRGLRNPWAKEEVKVVNSYIKSLVDKGLLRRSKSGKAFKPLYTTEEVTTRYHSRAKGVGPESWGKPEPVTSKTKLYKPEQSTKPKTGADVLAEQATEKQKQPSAKKVESAKVEEQTASEPETYDPAAAFEKRDERAADLRKRISDTKDKDLLKVSKTHFDYAKADIKDFDKGRKIIGRSSFGSNNQEILEAHLFLINAISEEFEKRGLSWADVVTRDGENAQITKQKIKGLTGQLTRRLTKSAAGADVLVNAAKENETKQTAKKEEKAKQPEEKSGAEKLVEVAKENKKEREKEPEKSTEKKAEVKTEQKTEPESKSKAEPEVEDKQEASPEKPKKKLNEENLKKNPSELIKEKVESFLEKTFGKEYDIRGKFRITDSAIEYKDRDGGGILIEGPEQESVKGKRTLIESAATQKQTGVKHDKPTDVTITLQNGNPFTKGAVPSKATDYLSSDEFKSKAKNAFGDSKVILSGQVVNAYDESTKRTVREGEDEAWMRSVNSSLFTKKGTKLGQKLIVTGVSVDGKPLTGADFYDAVEKLGLEGKARIDIKAPSYNADYAQEFDRRRKHIGNRNIPVRDRLQFAKDMERVDLLNAVDRFVERFREEQIADNEDGVLSSEAVEEFFDEQLEKFVKDYEDAHNYRWDVIDGEVVRIDNDTSRVDSASDVLEAMYDAYRLKKQGEAARRERLKRSLTNVLGVGEIAKAIKDNINRNVKSMTTAIDTGTFNLKVEGVDSPYGMTVTYVYDGDYKTLNQKKEAKDNGRGYYVVELFHSKGKAKNGNDIRIFRFNAGDIDTASSRSAMIIKEYERGITAAKESVMKMTRKSIRQKLANQLTKKMTSEGKLAFLTTNPDYKGEYKVGDFTAKVSEEYTPWHGEKVLDRYDMRLYYKGQEIGQYTYAVKKGKKPNLIQRISTAIHNANYNIGDNHFFDLLEAEQNYLVRQNKGKTTVIGPNGEISESMSDSPIDAINEATGQKGKADKVSEGTLERRRIRDEVITPSEKNPYRVKVDGKTYEVVYQFRKADDKYANGSTALQYRIYETGNEDITALVDVNKNNADITAKEAVEFVLKHPKMWGNHESAVESEVDAAIERSANESKAKEKQSGTPAEAGERNTNAESDRREGSDNRRPDGRRTVRSLRDVERKETRVAQSLEEREAESVVNNITRGRAKVRIVSFGDALSRELGLTRSTQNQYHSYEEKGTHVSGKVSGEVILPEHIPDGTIARRGIGGHEGTHAEFINKFGEEAKAKAVLFWNTFKNLHPNEASKMEQYIMLKKNYVGEYVKTEYDKLPKDIKEIAADEIFSHWAGGTIRTTSAEASEVATKCQLMLQDFLVKEVGFSPKAFSRSVQKIGGKEIAKGACLISEWYTIQDEVKAYFDLVNASLGKSEASTQTPGALASDDAEWAKMKAEEEGGKVRNLKQEKYQRDRKRDKTEINNNKAYEQAQAKTKEEVTAEQAARDLEEAKRIYGKDFEKVQESAKNFSEVKTRFDTDEFKQSKDKRDKAVRVKMDKLRKAYDAAAKSGNTDNLFSIYEALKDDPNLSDFYDEDVQRLIDQARRMGDENSDHYNQAAYPYAVSNAMRMMAHRFAKANEYQQIRHKMNETLRGSKSGALRKIAKSEKLTSAVARALVRWQVNPDTVFKMVDAFDKGSFGEGYKLAKELQTAHRKKYDVLMSARARFEDAKKMKNYEDFIYGKQTFKDYSGREWDMRSALTAVKYIESIMSTSGKKLGGTDGFAFEDAKGNLEFVDMKNVDATKLYKSLKEGLSDVATKFGDLSTQAFEDVKEPIRSTRFENDGIDVGMVGDDNTTAEKHGLEKAVYAPLTYANKNGDRFQYDIAKQDVYSDIPGFVKERSQNGGAYLLIRPYTEVVADYFEQVSNYLAYSGYNAKIRGLGKGSEYEAGLGTTLAEAFGADMGKWYQSYVEDLQTYKNEDDVEGVNSLLRKGRQQLQQGALLFSVSVPMKQISSYWAASGILHPDSLIKNYRIKLLKPKNSSDAATMLASRAMDNLEPSAAEAAKSAEKWLGKLKYSSKFIKIAANAINQMDYNTVSNLLTATEYDVLKYQFDGDTSKIGTEEFNKAVEELFQDVVDRSQPNFDKQMRAEYGRTDNEVIRMLSMFRTQQTQNLNLLAVAIGEYQAAKGTGNQAKATQTLKDTIKGQAASAFSLSMLTILADMLLHRQKKYEDEEQDIDMSKVLTRLGINAIEASSGTLWFGDAVAKWAIDRISGGSTKEFYGVNMGVISTVSDILENFETAIQSPTRSNIKKCAGNIATIMGIPLNNAYSMLNSAIMYAKDLTGNNEGDYDDILRYLDAQTKAAKKAEEKAAKAAAKAAEKSGADMLADTAEQNSSQSELNSTEEQKTAEVSTYLKKPYNALVEAGMTPERSQYVLDFMDTDNNDSIKQSEMWAFYKDNPDYEDYVIAMWDSYGYKTTWEAYKAKHK